MRNLSTKIKGVRTVRSFAVRILFAPLLVVFSALSVPAYSQSDDVGFESWDAVPEKELALNSGGTELNIGDIGLNLASNNASLNGNSVEGNVQTGKISNNDLNNVSGINSLMFNTGNNVNFQNNMQINIFLK